MKFSYIVDDAVAGCTGPLFPEHLGFLLREGIAGLVRLAARDEAAFTTEEIQEAGFQDCPEPVKDWSAPAQDQIDRSVRFVRSLVRQGKKAAVTCSAGRGRTGTLLACYLVSTGMSAPEAINFVRAKRPGSIEERDPTGRSTGQKEAIIEFERRVRTGKAVL
jgi:atypical dual specificity phosphatase